MAGEFPGMAVEVFAAAEWSENPGALAAAKAAIAGADLVVANLLFLEEHTAAIAPAPAARRPDCDATIGLISDKSIVGLTRMGDLDMAKPASAAMQMMKKLRGSGPPSADNGPSS